MSELPLYAERGAEVEGGMWMEAGRRMEGVGWRGAVHV